MLVNRIMNCKQVAEMLDVSLPTLRKAVREQGLPCVKIGSNIRFRLEAVEAWMRQQEESNDVSARANND